VQVKIEAILNGRAVDLGNEAARGGSAAPSKPDRRLSSLAQVRPDAKSGIH
jgi:hypothetical protein